MLGLLLLLVSTAEAVTLTGSSEYAVPGDTFTLTCDVPEEANNVQFYRRTTRVGIIQVGGDSQCYSVYVTPAVLCTPGVCSCQPSRANYATSFQWVIQPQAGDHSSVWYCNTNNPGTSQTVDSPNYTLKVAVPVTSVQLQNPPSGGQTIDVTDNQSTNLVCVTSTCRPSASVLWLVGATNYTSSSVPSVSSVANDLFITTSTMTFIPTKVMAGQKVICMTYNIGAVVQATLQPTLTVRYRPGAITFTPLADVVDTIENQTIPDVICSADCRPPCTYLWSGGGTNYANPLSLSKAVRGNAGQYVCIASNIVGQNTRTWNLIVRYPPKILSLSYTSGDADVSENGDKSLLCTVESYPSSTIQWYYKANTTQLLSTPDTLESTYTLTEAGCLDTGVYTCSASNSETITHVTMDIPVNVLCKPRQDFRVDVRLQYGLDLGENLAIPASFMSNPDPSYTWKFQNQNSFLSAVEDLIDRSDNFAIYNSYNDTHLAAMSIGIRLDLQERWFGLYIVTATNNQGSSTLNFTVETKGRYAEPVSGGSGPSTASVGLFIGSVLCLIVGVLLFMSGCLMRRGVIRSSKRKDITSPEVPLDNLRHSYPNVSVEQPVPIDTSNYEHMQARDPPSVYQELSPARQGNADSEDRNNYESLGRPNVYEELKVYENTEPKRK